jgi:hypothetical protein
MNGPSPLPSPEIVGSIIRNNEDKPDVRFVIEAVPSGITKSI